MEPVGRDADDGVLVGVLSKALRLLSLFRSDYPEWTLTELRRELGLSKTTTYRIARTMEFEGFLVFDETRATYHLGPAMIPGMYLVNSYSEIVRLAKPYLEDLVEKTQETACVAVEKDGAVVVADQALTPRTFKPAMPTGRVLDDIANANSKLFAAFSPQDVRARILAAPREPLTPNTIVDPAELAEELDRIAREGVAYDIEEQRPGVCGVSAPVRDQSGEMRAAITIVAPAERFDPDLMVKYAGLVREAADSLSNYLGYSPLAASVGS